MYRITILRNVVTRSTLLSTWFRPSSVDHSLLRHHQLYKVAQCNSRSPSFRAFSIRGGSGDSAISSAERQTNRADVSNKHTVESRKKPETLSILLRSSLSKEADTERREALRKLCKTYLSLHRDLRHSTLPAIVSFLSEDNVFELLRLGDMDDTTSEAMPLPGLKAFLIMVRGDALDCVRQKNSLGDEQRNQYLMLGDCIKRILFGRMDSLTLHRVEKENASLDILTCLMNATVHPVSSLSEMLEKRMGPHKRVYVLSDTELELADGSATPLVVLYVSMQPTIPSSMKEVWRTKGNEESLPVAAFYSISSSIPGVAGLGLGERCILDTVREWRKSESERCDHFTTLSPIPGFRLWLTQATGNAAVLSASSIPDDLILPADRAYMCTRWNCSPSDVCSVLLQRLEQQNNMADYLEQEEDEKLLAASERTLVRLVAYFLSTISNDKPIDGVARFHCGNGAKVYRINYDADPSPAGWQNSFGIMVNYLYEWDKLKNNKEVLQREKSVVFCKEHWPL